MSLFSSFTDALEPWKSADMGCIAVRKISPEDLDQTAMSPQEQQLERSVKQSEALISLIEAAIARREAVLHSQESYCLPASTSSGTMGSVQRLLKARQTDMALAREEVDESDLLATQVDMTDLLEPDEVGVEQGALENVVSMGSILGKQGVEERQVVVANASPAFAPTSSSLVALDDSDVEDLEVDHDYYSFKPDEDGGDVEEPKEHALSDAGAASTFVAEISDGAWGPWAVEQSERKALMRAEYMQEHEGEVLRAGPMQASLFHEDCLHALEAGVEVVLYVKGKAGIVPTSKLLKLQDESGQLTVLWTDSRGASTDLTSGSVALRDIKSVEQGPQNSAVSLAASRKDWTCFSLVMNQGATFDFSVANSMEYSYAVCGLRLLLGDTVPRHKFLWKRMEILLAGESYTNSSTAPFSAMLKGLSVAVRNQRNDRT
ncbi:hypothetical protein AB1Y20_009323 [Prymnesium parvum]|uniref:Uncharacterized protein n=1 Tax=Prymnesium parvum TaxID=97485 RepID=A0AB34K449_PRYPA